MNDWPDDWRRVTVTAMLPFSDTGGEYRVRLDMIKVTDSAVSFEMSADSLVELAEILVEEVGNLPEAAKTQVELDTWQRFNTRLSSSIRSLAGREEPSTKEK
jgi:hypothetical protein